MIMILSKKSSIYFFQINIIIIILFHALLLLLNTSVVVASWENRNPQLPYRREVRDHHYHKQKTASGFDFSRQGPRGKEIKADVLPLVFEHVSYPFRKLELLSDYYLFFHETDILPGLPGDKIKTKSGETPSYPYYAYYVTSAGGQTGYYKIWEHPRPSLMPVKTEQHDTVDQFYQYKYPYQYQYQYPVQSEPFDYYYSPSPSLPVLSKEGQDLDACYEDGTEAEKEVEDEIDVEDDYESDADESESKHINRDLKLESASFQISLEPGYKRPVLEDQPRPKYYSYYRGPYVFLPDAPDPLVPYFAKAIDTLDDGSFVDSFSRENVIVPLYGYFVPCNMKDQSKGSYYRITHNYPTSYLPRKSKPQTPPVSPLKSSVGSGIELSIPPITPSSMTKEAKFAKEYVPKTNKKGATESTLLRSYSVTKRETESQSGFVPRTSKVSNRDSRPPSSSESRQKSASSSATSSSVPPVTSSKSIISDDSSKLLSRTVMIVPGDDLPSKYDSAWGPILITPDGDLRVLSSEKYMAPLSIGRPFPLNTYKLDKWATLICIFDRNGKMDEPLHIYRTSFVPNGILLDPHLFFSKYHLTFDKRDMLKLIRSSSSSLPISTGLAYFIDPSSLPTPTVPVAITTKPKDIPLSQYSTDPLPEYYTAVIFPFLYDSRYKKFYFAENAIAYREPGSDFFVKGTENTKTPKIYREEIVYGQYIISNSDPSKNKIYRLYKVPKSSNINPLSPLGPPTDSLEKKDIDISHDDHLSKEPPIVNIGPIRSTYPTRSSAIVPVPNTAVKVDEPSTSSSISTKSSSIPMVPIPIRTDHIVRSSSVNEQETKKNVADKKPISKNFRGPATYRTSPSSHISSGKKLQSVSLSPTVAFMERPPPLKEIPKDQYRGDEPPKYYFFVECPLVFNEIKDVFIPAGDHITMGGKPNDPIVRREPFVDKNIYGYFIVSEDPRLNGVYKLSTTPAPISLPVSEGYIKSMRNTISTTTTGSHQQGQGQVVRQPLSILSAGEKPVKITK